MLRRWRRWCHHRHLASHASARYIRQFAACQAATFTDTVADADTFTDTDADTFRWYGTQLQMRIHILYLFLCGIREIVVICMAQLWMSCRRRCSCIRKCTSICEFSIYVSVRCVGVAHRRCSLDLLEIVSTSHKR